MSYLDHYARALDEHAKEMVETYLAAGRRGDWRALDVYSHVLIDERT